MIAVWSPDAPGAIAELPLSARPSAGPEGALALLSGGDGWPERACAAIDAGARAVAVADPGGAGLDRLDALAAAADAAGVAVLVHRRAAALLHAHGDRDDLRAPVAIVLECAAGEAALPAALRDALGLARELGSARELERRLAGARSVFAAVAGPTGSASVVADRITGSAPALLRATVLGRSARLELELDDAAATTRVLVATEAGASHAPRDLEDPARRVLRLALATLGEPGARGAAAAEGDHGLAALRRDTELAHAVLHG
ncbi:MAG: hypothetical protein J0G30_01760 [Actinomycetales bacterium]|nr:hypothetical protein [Actinomycetales bacterium]